MQSVAPYNLLCSTMFVSFPITAVHVVLAASSAASSAVINKGAGTSSRHIMAKSSRNDGRTRQQKNLKRLRKEDIYDSFDLCDKIPLTNDEANELLVDSSEDDYEYDDKAEKNAMSPAGIKIKNYAGNNKSSAQPKIFLSLTNILSDLGLDIALACTTIGSDCATISFKQCAEERHCSNGDI